MKKQIKKYDAQHLRNLSIYEKQIAEIYESAVKEAAAIGITVGNFNPAKRFKFSDYPITTERINKLINSFANNVQTVVVNGVRSEWTLANNKNNELSRIVFGDKIGKLTSDEYRKLFSNNDKALAEFLKRKKAGLNLSQRVWKNTQNFKDEIELGLGLGIKNGKSANEIAKDLHKYLQNPEALAKDVSKEYGKAEEIKQRIKRRKRNNQSSLSSAKRLARTETNIAYHTADYERWQSMDFVVGIQISLSGNHTVKTPKGILPLIDICDDLRGKYPKTFKFTGWHPNCRCHATPIMKEPGELFSDKPSKNEVKDVPESFNKWIENNRERAKGWESLPYFIKDNQQYVKNFNVNTYSPFEKKFTRALKTSEAMKEALGNYLQKEYPLIPNTEIAAIYHYTKAHGAAYRQLNNQLRKNNLSDFNIAFSELLSNGLSKMPSVNGIVFRKMVVNKTLLNSFINATINNDIILFKSFTSATTDSNVLKEFMKGKKWKNSESSITFKIKSKNGKSIEKASEFNGMKNELVNQHEVLFDKNSKFKFLNFNIKDDNIEFILKEI